MRNSNALSRQHWRLGALAEACGAIGAGGADPSRAALGEHRPELAKRRAVLARRAASGDRRGCGGTLLMLAGRRWRGGSHRVGCAAHCVPWRRADGRGGAMLLVAVVAGRDR